MNQPISTLNIGAKNLAMQNTPKPLVGDWLIIFASIILVGFLFVSLWSFEPAAKLRIRQGDKVVGTFSLNQTREINIHGPLGDSKIIIKAGQVRFASSPCHNQYCVHQDWLKRAGQAAICIPNQVSLELLGVKKTYDSLNY